MPPLRDREFHDVVTSKLACLPRRHHRPISSTSSNSRKALYELKQAPRAWYERLRDYLLSKGFKMGKVDTTLFTKKLGNDLFVLQIYVDDIIFGSTNQDFYEEFGKMMGSEFEMSMIGELSYFLDL